MNIYFKGINEWWLRGMNWCVPYGNLHMCNSCISTVEFGLQINTGWKALNTNEIWDIKGNQEASTYTTSQCRKCPHLMDSGSSPKIWLLELQGKEIKQERRKFLWHNRVNIGPGNLRKNIKYRRISPKLCKQYFTVCNGINSKICLSSPLLGCKSLLVK